MGMKIRGNTQIIANTIENGQIALDAAIATSKLEDAGNIFMADGTISATNNFNLGNNKITNLAEPTIDTDAATKMYVDSTAQGLIVKDSARVATTTNLDVTYLNNILTSSTNCALIVDNIIVNINDRILVKNQSATLQNGLYYVTSTGDIDNPFILTRCLDADGSPANEMKGGIFTFVQEGDINSDSGWIVVSNDPITVGFTPINWVQFSGAGQINAGSALIKTGNQLDVVVASTGGLDISSDALTIKFKNLGGLTSDVDGLYINTNIAGDGLVWNETTGAIDVNFSSTIGLTIVNDALQLLIPTDNGLTIDENGLTLNPNIAKSGLKYLDGMLYVSLDDLSGLKFAYETGKLRIDTDIAGNGLVWNTTTGVIDVNLSSAAGLTIVNDALQLLIPAGSGMSITEAGLSLDSSIAGDGILYTDGILNIELDINSALTFNDGKLTIDSSIAGTGLTWADGIISITGSLGSNLNNGWIYRGNELNQTTAYRDVRNEVPSTTNHIIYTIAYTLVSGTESVFVNGVLQRFGTLNDYTISNGDIVFTSANESSDVIVISYLATT
jgi:hypothetical protein